MTRGFEAASQHETISVFSAFEVMEQVEAPSFFIRAQFEKYGCSTLVFNTVLYEENVVLARVWWY